MAISIENIKSKFKKIKIEYLIVFVALIAVIGIFLSGNSNGGSNSESISVEAYVADLEQKLSNKLSQISGAGKVTVIISVKRGVTTEIATQKVITNDSNGVKSEESPILVSGKPIILSEIYPEICGVIIIAKGANDIKVKMSLLSAAQTFLDITSEKIEILTMR